jgi:hypothetical protein
MSLNMEAKVTEVTAKQYHCVRCGNVWVGRNGNTPKYCSSCRQPWASQAKFRVTRKEGNSHYISTMEKAHEQNSRRLYSLDKDEARRTSIIRDMTAIPANLRKSTSCLNIYSGRPDYPVYNKEVYSQ